MCLWECPCREWGGCVCGCVPVESEVGVSVGVSLSRVRWVCLWACPCRE